MNFGILNLQFLLGTVLRTSRTYSPYLISGVHVTGASARAHTHTHTHTHTSTLIPHQTRLKNGYHLRTKLPAHYALVPHTFSPTPMHIYIYSKSFTSGLCSVVHGLWHVISGVLCEVRDVWCVVRDVWCVVCCLLSVVFGRYCVICRVVNGDVSHCVVCDSCCVVRGLWYVVCGVGGREWCDLSSALWVLRFVL